PRPARVSRAAAAPSRTDRASATYPAQFGSLSAGREVAAGTDINKISFLKLPEGFCAHYFGNVGNVRQIRFAPGGELFVASPTKGTTGGGVNGKSAMVVMPDDDRDGLPIPR
ncbi:MAG: hypothetical protein QM756_06220, partial [Polyangiaceae bacterium]